MGSGYCRSGCVASPSPMRPPQRGLKRKAGLVLLGIGVLIALVLSVSQVSFNLTFLRPNTNEQVLILVALSALIFLLLLALSFMLIRNLLKLYAERRLGVLGSKFRTRMVVGALLLSLVPVLFLFLFAYGLMNRSIDKWFSGPVEELTQHAEQAADLLANYAAENARAEARAIAIAPDVQRSFATGNFSAVVTEFHRHDATLQGGFAIAMRDDDAMASVNAPEAWGSLRNKLPSTGDRPGRLTLNGTTYMLGSARVGEDGRILVAMPIPQAFSHTLNDIEESQQRYYGLAQQRRLIRRTYMGLLLLITILVLFATTWIALFLSKLVTRPVSALAEATEEISRGRFDYRIDVPAADELGQLVTSFNDMAADLEASSRKLADANTELDRRRRQMETILESIPTGVLSLDADRRVAHINAAFNRLFGSHNGGGIQFAAGSSLRDIFPEEVVADLTHMLRRADRMGMIAGQLELSLGRDQLNVAVTVAALGRGSERAGYVLVFEDLSDLLKAQKQAAWREVARRVAHEIKNPLTPIALSAERIQKHLERGTPGDTAIMQACADTISGAVETVRRLVDEFSTLARFPAAEPRPSDLNGIVENALALFDGRMNGILLETHLAPELPKVLADPEAIKRVVANLVDNAMEATEDSLVKEVHISTGVVGPKDTVELIVADSGHGVTRELKEKLFLPYFSTKKRGTGLGLAIVNRIIEDHHGSIRVEENSPVGARFIVELPVADAQAKN
jgi:two-component system, NtrC family, nitrogen regulation sensor histidine kinase NtrY